jgi:hypothetical protein
MGQERPGASQRSTNTSQSTQKAPSAIKKKVIRRDPEKRRTQNRLAQQTYSELSQRGSQHVFI